MIQQAQQRLLNELAEGTGIPAELEEEEAEAEEEEEDDSG